MLDFRLFDISTWHFDMIAVDERNIIIPLCSFNRLTRFHRWPCINAANLVKVSSFKPVQPRFLCMQYELWKPTCVQIANEQKKRPRLSRILTCESRSHCWFNRYQLAAEEKKRFVTGFAEIYNKMRFFLLERKCVFFPIPFLLLLEYHCK